MKTSQKNLLSFLRRTGWDDIAATGETLHLVPWWDREGRHVVSVDLDGDLDLGRALAVIRPLVGTDLADLRETIRDGLADPLPVGPPLAGDIMDEMTALRSARNFGLHRLSISKTGPFGVADLTLAVRDAGDGRHAFAGEVLLHLLTRTETIPDDRLTREGRRLAAFAGLAALDYVSPVDMGAVMRFVSDRVAAMDRGLEAKDPVLSAVFQRLSRDGWRDLLEGPVIFQAATRLLPLPPGTRNRATGGPRAGVLVRPVW